MALQRLTFGYTGAVQTFTVPQGVTQVTIDAYGGQGGGTQPPHQYGGTGGLGGRTQATLDVVPGETLTLRIGGSGPSGGWNGGGISVFNWGGGGATDVRRGGVGLSSRVLVAGGGGSSGTSTSSVGSNGGAGGGLVGGDGVNVGGLRGTGGTQTAGGEGGQAAAGLGQGAPGSVYGGGGGGGLYGGGGGHGDQGFGSGGGGGGSALVPAGGSTAAGVRSGDGILMLSYEDNLPPDAPFLTVPTAVDIAEPFDVQVGFSDPNPGDSASQSFLRGRLSGTVPWTVSLSRQSAETTIRVPGYTLTEGTWEFQGASRDARGLPVAAQDLRWSGSKFAEASIPPPGPVPLNPRAGQTIPAATQVWTISVPELDALQWWVFADANGQPNEAQILDSGTVTTGDLRTFTARNLPNSSTVHTRFRAGLGGLWGPPTTVSNPVRYTVPVPPQTYVTPVKTQPVVGDWTDVVEVQGVNPAPTAGEPRVAWNEVWRRLTAVGGDGIRLRDQQAGREVRVAPNGKYVDAYLSSGVECQWRFVAVSEGGLRSPGEWSVSATPTDPSTPGNEGVFEDAVFDPAVFD